MSKKNRTMLNNRILTPNGANIYTRRTENGIQNIIYVCEGVEAISSLEKKILRNMHYIRCTRT